LFLFEEIWQFVFYPQEKELLRGRFFKRISVIPGVTGSEGGESEDAKKAAKSRGFWRFSRFLS